METPQDSPLQEKLIPQYYWVVSLSGTKSLGVSVGAEVAAVIGGGGVRGIL